ncbi:MAG: trypsin-like peptidase domain-containing protein [Chloroflexi bacterium]|nr:trypsin-like peptidase domain-containing protein [Chloroflexota bacterium]
MALIIYVLAVMALLGVACVAPPPPTPTPTIAPTPTSVPAPSAFSRSFPDVAGVTAKVRPAVVSVWTQSVNLNFFLQPVPESGAGSGIIYDKRGYILTNNHVVEGAKEINVTLPDPDNRRFTAKLIGRDASTDLAVIKIEGDNLPVASFGDSDKLRIGDWVVAIGNALGLDGGPTVTAGVVSALGRSIAVEGGALHELIQTDAAINPGNSGGPLINLEGEVVGINSAIAGRAQGIGFSISINSARPIVDQLQTQGRVVWPWLGVYIQGISAGMAQELNLPVKVGVLVRGTEPGGPAAKAGLKENDIIVALNGQKTDTVRQLQDMVGRHKVGDKVQVDILRNGRTQTLEVTLGEMPRS